MKHTFWIVLILVSTQACRTKSNDTVTEKDTLSTQSVILNEQQKRILGIKLEPITKREIPNVLQANGVLDVPPQNLVTISAPMSGFVKSTKLLQGMKVTKGEVIAVLEHQDYVQLQQDYLDNFSKLEYLQLEYKRQEELAAGNINSQKTLQQAKSNFESVTAQVEGLRAKLRMLNIDAKTIARNGITSEIRLYAPLSGFVTEVNVNIGRFVNSTDQMFRIVDLSHLHAEIQIYERDIHKVKIGQKVKFLLPGETSPRTATVYLVGKEITADRTVRVHCHLDEEDESLLPGMFITASIETLSMEAETIPSVAVVSFEGRQGVFVKKQDKHYELIEIKTGINASGFTAIEPGSFLKSGDSVVTEGCFELLGMLKNMADE